MIIVTPSSPLADGTLGSRRMNDIMAMSRTGLSRTCECHNLFYEISIPVLQDTQIFQLASISGSAFVHIGRSIYG